ncbi:MAG TPA: sugar transferase [Candidatus Saccharimonadales bacterium]
MKNNASLIYNVCLVVGDFLALVAAFVVAYIVRVKVDTAPLIHTIHPLAYLGIFLGVLPFWILIFALLGLYDSNIYEKRFKEFGRLLVGSFIGLLFVVFWSFVSTQPIFPARLVPIYGFIFGFLFLLVFRNAARFTRTRLFNVGIGLTNVLIVGNTDTTGELVESLSGHRSGYRIIGVVGGKRHVGTRAIPTFPRFADFLKGNVKGVNSIIQTELYADESRNAEILTYAQEHHVSYRFAPGNTELFVGNIDVELFRSGLPMIVVNHTALLGWGRIVKRLSDLVFSALLIVLLSPLFLIIMMLEKFTEPHAPILYKPARLTRFDHSVHVFKFRTMKNAYNGITPEQGFAKLGRPELAKEYRANGDQLSHDPRISALGRVLRAASLDELPQLFNVFRGELSFIGPRALEAVELNQSDKKNLILSVKSGLVSLAVVAGRPGISFEERRKLDLYYVQNWSYWLDVTIFLKTLRVIVGRLLRGGARY